MYSANMITLINTFKHMIISHDYLKSPVNVLWNKAWIPNNTMCKHMTPLNIRSIQIDLVISRHLTRYMYKWSTLGTPGKLTRDKGKILSDSARAVQISWSIRNMMVMMMLTIMYITGKSNLDSKGATFHISIQYAAQITTNRRNETATRLT